MKTLNVKINYSEPNKEIKLQHPPENLMSGANKVEKSELSVNTVAFIRCKVALFHS